MKYLILGSRGQIGSSLAEYIGRKSHTATHYDILDGNIFDLRLKDTAHLMKAVTNVDFVFFLAFDVGGSTYLSRYQHSYEFLHNNMQIMTNTFEVLEKSKTPFLFASSQMSNMADSPYGITKSIGELYSRQIGGLIVKFWNVYGIEADLNKAHVITDFALKALLTGKINLLTDGEESRQFLYADDCSQCLHFLSSKYNAIDRARDLHVTNFKWTTIAAIANNVAEIVKNTSVILGDKSDQLQRMRRNEPDDYILNYWQPNTELHIGLATIIDKYSILLQDTVFRESALRRLETLSENNK